MDTDFGLHQQHRQLQAPKQQQQQQQQPQTTPQQQEGELMDTTGGVTEHQHGPNPVDMMGPSSSEEAHATRAIPSSADGDAPTIAPPESDAATTAVATANRAGLPALNRLEVPISPSREGRIQKTGHRRWSQAPNEMCQIKVRKRVGHY